MCDCWHIFTYLSDYCIVSLSRQVLDYKEQLVAVESRCQQLTSRCSDLEELNCQWSQKNENLLKQFEKLEVSVQDWYQDHNLLNNVLEMDIHVADGAKLQAEALLEMISVAF